MLVHTAAACRLEGPHGPLKLSPSTSVLNATSSGVPESAEKVPKSSIASDIGTEEYWKRERGFQKDTFELAVVVRVPLLHNPVPLPDRSCRRLARRLFALKGVSSVSH